MTTINRPDDLLTRQQAADYLGWSLQTVDARRKSGELPYKRLGAVGIRMRRGDVDKLLKPPEEGQL